MKAKKILINLLIIILLILSICECVRSNNTLTTTSYTIESNKIDNSIKFVFISDLHNKEFGEDNSDLVSLISHQSPDFIALGGDFVTRYYENDDIMKTLISKLSEIAPVYCSLGNHELDLTDKIIFKEDIENSGGTLLENEYTTFTVKSGEKLILAGMSMYPYNHTIYREFWNELNEVCKNSDDTYSLLLFHRPEYMLKVLPESEIDLVVSGHTHGGLVQMPLIGGLFSSNQGLFPAYDKGFFELGDSDMIISSGLANSNPLPRFNNPPEVCVITIT